LSQLPQKAFGGVCLSAVIVIPVSVKFLGQSCFIYGRSFCGIAFESGSQLSRIDGLAFRENGLAEIVIPAPLNVARISDCQRSN
jgi:hypothetical protein